MSEWFDSALFRFALSGTLIGLYGLVDALARRGGIREAEHAGPRWVHPAIFASITMFYLLIRPFGGPIAGGAGNLAGALLAIVAMGLRWRVRSGSARVRYPAAATRMLFYFALPLAVGVPLGWVVLTLPAWALSAWLAVREDRLRLGAERAGARGTGVPSARWVPGIW